MKKCIFILISFFIYLQCVNAQFLTQSGTYYTGDIYHPNGNLGLGTQTIGSRLQVNGGAAIGYSSSTTAPTNGLCVSGNVGLGTTTPSYMLHALVNTTSGWNNMAVFENSNDPNGGGTRLWVKTSVSSLQLTAYGTITTLNNNNLSKAVCVSAANTGSKLLLGANTNGAVQIFTNNSYQTPQFTFDINGNFGIGTTTTMSSKLQVNGNAAIGYSNTTSAPTNGLCVAGSLGIGTITPAQKLDVQGNAAFSGNVGVGTTTPSVNLDVKGTGYFHNLNIGTGSGELVVLGPSYFGETTSGGVNIGFDLLGGESGMSDLSHGKIVAAIFGNGYAYGTDNLTSGLHITQNGGNVGVKTAYPGSALQVNGGAAIGYNTATSAPTNGLLVKGMVGINHAEPLAELQVGNDYTNTCIGSADGIGAGYIGFNIAHKADGNWANCPGQSSEAGGAVIYGTGDGNMAFLTVPFSNNQGSGGQIFSNTEMVSKVRMLLSSQGNLGIGTLAPSQPLQVKGNIAIEGEVSSLLFGMNYPTTSANMGQWGIEYVELSSTELSSGLNFWKPSGSNGFGNYFLFLKDDGNIGIGTNLANNPNGYRLAVNGKIGAKEVVVETNSSTWWPDYVFDNSHKLMDLDSLHSYVTINKHLPEIPDASEISSKGINLGEMDALLLKKIEELTLYVIKQNEDIQQLKKENEILEEKLNNMNK
jgi:hypothetical protein